MASSVAAERKTAQNFTKLDIERVKKEQTVAQYDCLKAHLNPHFLFNSLNVLTTLVHKDPHMAEQFVLQLSKVYRYILEVDKAAPLISLAEEMKHLEAYLFLMKIRFGDNFQFDNQLTKEENKYRIAPLTLQILVENALQHNEVSKMHPLSISVFFDNNYLIMRNNLRLKKQQNNTDKNGLVHLKARYKLLSTQPVLIEKTMDFFTIKIPLVSSVQ
jgi:LytS/YehU family sensor histidine kinase